MEIEFVGRNGQRLLWVLSLLLCLPTGLALLGRQVTPVEAGEPVLLSSDRWLAAHLARQARRETIRLYRDAGRLRALLDEPSPDPVSAMLLAQGIYARQRTGTSATATARQSLIVAAETSARYATGALAYNDALSALEEALALLDPLRLPDDLPLDAGADPGGRTSPARPGRGADAGLP